MYKLKIISVGKNKEDWLEEALQEYVKRLQSVASIEWLWVKDDAQLIQVCEKEAVVIALDPKGTLRNSEAFKEFLFKEFQHKGSRVTFVIGGAEGLPELIRKAYPLISLFSMTFTHQMTRLILIEQIYRAFEIEKGSQYHKVGSLPLPLSIRYRCHYRYRCPLIFLKRPSVTETKKG